MKRYFHIPELELELLENESKEEGIIYCGEIKGLVPIREILQKTSEELLLHPIIEDTEKTYAAAVAAGVNTKNNDSDSFTEYYKLYDKKPCSYWNCPIHFGNLQIFKHPKFLLLGESINHPWVVKKNKLAYLLRLAKLVQASTFSIMSLDLLSKLSEVEDYDDNNIIPSYYDEQQ
jgi:hypothetical protein